VTVLDTALPLHHNAAKVHLSNGNPFEVPARLTLKLRGKRAKRAGLTAAITSLGSLPADGSSAIRVRLGSKRGKLVRRFHSVHVLVRVVVRDPMGDSRVVKAPLALRAPPR
jgi:hypothetical protein